MNIGDEYIELETGRYLRVRFLSPHKEFATFDQLINDQWIYNTNPVRTHEIQFNLNARIWIPNTEAGKLFYVKE